MKNVYLATMIFMFGCMPDTKRIDITVDRISSLTEIVAQKILSEGVLQEWQSTMSLEGINPKYVVEIEGKWVIGIEATVKVGMEGIAGQVDAAAKGDQKKQVSITQTMQIVYDPETNEEILLVLNPETNKYERDDELLRRLKRLD